jgi:hypothetical protein
VEDCRLLIGGFMHELAVALALCLCILGIARRRKKTELVGGSPCVWRRRSHGGLLALRLAHALVVVAAGHSGLVRFRPLALVLLLAHWNTWTG